MAESDESDEKDPTELDSVVVVRSSFDPPLPPDPSSLETAATMVGALGLAGAAVALDVASGGVLSTLAILPGWEDGDEAIDVRALEQAVPGLAETSAPLLARDQRVLCTQCSAAVPFASMALSEDGYFCAACAADNKAPKPEKPL